MSNDHIRWSLKEFSVEFIRRMVLNNSGFRQPVFLSQAPLQSIQNIILSITNNGTGLSKLFCDRVISKVRCLQCEKLFQNMEINNCYRTVET